MREYFVWLAKVVTLIIVVLFVVPVVIASMVAAVQSVGGDAAEGKKMVAVIELNGVIDSSKDVLEQLQKQIKNKKTKGIVLAINSPGGSVGPSQEIYAAVKRWKSKKPIVVSMGSVAASGGLYSALGASKVFCQPGTLTGSIGVIMQVPNFTKIADWAGVNMVTVKSGALKDVGNSFRDMTPEERAFLEKTLADVHQDFISAVVEGRGLPPQEVAKWADGRVILGSQAKEYKLVDGYGDVYEAARTVFELLGEPLKEGEEPQVFYPTEPFDEFKKALETISKLPAIVQPKFEPLYLMQ